MADGNICNPQNFGNKSYGDTTGHEGILECTGIVADESSRTPQFYLSVVLKNETDHPLQVPLTGYTGPLNVDMNFRLVEVMENHEKSSGKLAGKQKRRQENSVAGRTFVHSK